MTTHETKEEVEFSHVNSMGPDKPAQADGAERDYTGTAKKTDPEEIRLVRKLDMWIMPCLCLMYFLNYVDRNAIAQARLNNLEEDLGMSGTQFNTCVSILFVGYVLMQVPSNMLITKVRPGMYMSVWMLVWAAVSGCTALVTNYAGLVVCRFFLGITEAPVSLSQAVTRSC
jgi:MFS family permease